MGTTITSVLDDYEAITSEQLRMWSAGSAKRRLRHFENRYDWRDVIGTIWDQRVFGPIKDWECACGQFKGQIYAGMKCPICRVQVGLSKVRRFRFAHINLPLTISHPFIADAEPMDAIPIVPAEYWEDRLCKTLPEIYEELIRLSQVDPDAEKITGTYGQVIVHLEDLYEKFAEFYPEDAERIARGMCLKPKSYHVEETGEVYDWGELNLAEDWQPPAEDS